MEAILWTFAALAMMATTVVFVAGMFLSQRVLLRNREARRIEDRWRRFAEERGLHHGGRTGDTRVLRGVIDGRRLRIEAIEHPRGLDWIVLLAAHRPLPHRRDLPPRTRLVEGGVEFTLRRLREEDFDARIDELLERVRAMEDAFDTPWREAGARFGLRPEPRVGARLPTLSGTVDADPVRMLQREDELGTFIEVRARWTNPRLGALEVARKGLLAEEIDLDNPVLGMLLSAWSDQPEAVRARFADDTVTEALLEVVHGHEGSRVLPSWVVLQSREGPEHAEALLRAALRLRALLARP